jgi:uncharacterized protein
MVKPRGSICNLDCQYCFYLKKEKLYPGATFRMSDATLEEFTRQYIQAQHVPEVTFSWQGGEPTLMGLPFFQKAVAYQQKYRKPGMNVHNSFQTNGILLDPDWCTFFHENNFLVGLSIDGPERLHNIYRRDKGHQPVFQAVMRAAELLNQHAVEFNTLTCVSAANAAYGLEVYRFLRDEISPEKPRFMQFIPIVERDRSDGFQKGNKLTNRSVSGEQYGRFLIEVFDEWVRKDVGQVYVQLFDSALGAWLGQRPGLCVYEETCGLGLALEFNGDLYSCDHFVEPDHQLGNIMVTPLADLVNGQQQYSFGAAKRDTLPRYCLQCPVRFICNGGCPKDRVLRTPQGEPGLNALCVGYKAFFSYIDRPMKIMSALLRDHRAPAEIMLMLTNDPPLRDLPATEMCPCGSGKPVGACHQPVIEQPNRKRKHSLMRGKDHDRSMPER